MKVDNVHKVTTKAHIVTVGIDLLNIKHNKRLRSGFGVRFATERSRVRAPLWERCLDYPHRHQELLKEIAARQSAVITDSLSWPSLDHPQANLDGVFARIVHLKKGKVVTDPLTLLIQETFRNSVLALKMWRTQIDHSTSFGYMDTFNGTTTQLYLPFFERK
ncbi:hypothetical protein DPMN_048444 [Dreissena polymorpha]|uniref:Uncharacterized protein n=1 Tax=Dreissena polymorpha TaxID=45954 RepID=A0A9D4DBP7_DREPO|nr:hypothetical protein DPMN_048444 [Dreissena polymorpha]